MDGLFTETTPQYGDNNVGWYKGKEYEEWVIAKYPTVYPGRKLTLLQGKQEQLRGETKEGVEIKFDDKIYAYCHSGRVYIEMYEKSRPENRDYVESGIFRDDNTKLLLIGDYSIWFLFSKQWLRWIERLDPPFLYRPKPTPTSIGFCIPVPNAKRLCLDFYRF